MKFKMSIEEAIKKTIIENHHADSPGNSMMMINQIASNINHHCWKYEEIIRKEIKKFFDENLTNENKIIITINKRKWKATIKKNLSYKTILDFNLIKKNIIKGGE